MNALTSTAVSLHAAGFHPIVEAPGQKFPVAKAWQQQAGRSVEEVAADFARAPVNAGIGTVTGAGFIVIDVDTKNGIDGRAALHALEERLGALPKTITVTTPSGGEHRYFRTSAKVINSVSKLAPGIDVRGVGGQVVVPPTRIAAGAYCWAEGCAPDAQAMAVLPAAWESALLDQQRPSGASVIRDQEILCVPRADTREAERRALYMQAVSDPSISGEGGTQPFMRAARAAVAMSRSREDAVAALVRWDAEMSTPPWGEAECRRAIVSLIDKYGVQRGAKLDARPGISEGSAPVDARVAALNDDWFIFDEGGSIYVGRFVVDVFAKHQRRRRLMRYSFPDFKKKFLRVDIGRGLTVGDAWLRWPGARQYDRVVFDPSGAATPSDVLNLWMGWAVTPAPGDWGVIRRHVEDVICGGNSEYAEYLLCWLARMVQHPDEPGQVVPVLRGREGVGKSVLGLAVRRLTGQHGMAVSNPKHVVGHFNAHLRDLLFLEASEAFFAGNKEQANQLKALITDDMLLIEPKNVDPIPVPNFLHVLMTTNEEWAVQASHDSRRYFVLDVSEARRGDSAYFETLFAAVADDAVIGAMLWDLLHRDLSTFRVQRFPVTKALEDQRERSLTGVRAWAWDLAQRGYIETSNGRQGWRRFFTTEEMFDDYVAWHRARKYAGGELPRGPFGKQLQGDLGLERKRRVPADCAGDLRPDDRQSPGYVVGPLSEFRVRVARASGLSEPASEDGDNRVLEIDSNREAA